MKIMMKAQVNARVKEVKPNMANPITTAFVSSEKLMVTAIEEERT